MPGDAAVTQCVNIVNEIHKTEKTYIENLAKFKKLNELLTLERLKSYGVKNYKQFKRDLENKLTQYLGLNENNPFKEWVGRFNAGITKENYTQAVAEFLSIASKIEKEAGTHYSLIAANHTSLNNWLNVRVSLKKTFWEKFLEIVRLNEKKTISNMECIEDIAKQLRQEKQESFLLPSETLSSLLILPVQRVPRYKLLISEFIKHCDQEEAVEILEGEQRKSLNLKNIATTSNENIAAFLEKNNAIVKRAEEFVGTKEGLTYNAWLIQGLDRKIFHSGEIEVDDNIVVENIEHAPPLNDGDKKTIQLAQLLFSTHYYTHSEWSHCFTEQKQWIKGRFHPQAISLKKKIDLLAREYNDNHKNQMDFNNQVAETISEIKKASRFAFSYLSNELYQLLVNLNLNEEMPTIFKNKVNLSFTLEEANNIIHQHVIFHAFLPFQRYTNRGVTWFSTESKLKHGLAKKLLEKRDEIYRMSLEQRNQVMNGKSLYEYLCQEMHQVLNEFINQNISFDKKVFTGKFFKYLQGAGHYLDKINPNKNSRILTRTILLHGAKDPAANDHLALILNGLRVSQYYMNTHWGKQVGFKKNNKMQDWVIIADDFSKRLQQIYIHLDENKIDQKDCYFLCLQTLDKAVIRLEHLANKGATQSPLYTFLKTMQKKGPRGRPKNSSMPLELIQQNIVPKDAKRDIFNCIQDQIKQPFVNYREKNMTCWRKYIVMRCSDSYKEKWKEAEAVVNENNTEGQQNIRDFLQNKLDTHFKSGDQNKSAYQDGRLKQAAIEAQNFVNRLKADL